MKDEEKEAVDYSSLRPQFTGIGVVNGADGHSNYQYLGGLYNGEFDQTAVDSYIISSFPKKSMWEHPFITYPNRQMYYLLGRDSDVLMKELEEMTKTSVEDVRAYADIYEKLLNEGVKTSGGRKTVLEESGEFDAYLEYK